MANRLRELIERKYGKDKFEFGCEMVAQFLSFGQRKHSRQLINKWCNNEEEFIADWQKDALRNLLNVKTVEDLYSIPETTAGAPTDAEGTE